MSEAQEANSENEDNYIFIHGFSHAFHSTTDPGTRQAILEDFCNRVISRQRDLGGDAAALLAVCHHYDKKQRSSIDLERLKLIARELEGREWAKVRAQQSGHYSAQRKRRALKKLIALWSYQHVEHYQWKLLSWSTLEKLAKIAYNLPSWNEFVDIANCSMILRHEASVGRSDARAIGEHVGRTNHSRRDDSPLEPADIDNVYVKILGYQPKNKRKAPCELAQADISWLRTRIQQWLNPCTCLSVRGKTVKPNEFRRYAVELDSFGMLIHSLASRQRPCGGCGYESIQRERPCTDPALPTNPDGEGVAPYSQRLERLNSHIEASEIPNGQLITTSNNFCAIEPKKRLCTASNFPGTQAQLFDTGDTKDCISAIDHDYAKENEYSEVVLGASEPCIDYGREGTRKSSKSDNSKGNGTRDVSGEEGFLQNQPVDEAPALQRPQFGGLRLPAPAITRSSVHFSVSDDDTDERIERAGYLSKKKPEQYARTTPRSISCSQSPSMWTKQAWTPKQWEIALDDRGKLASLEMFYNESEEPCSRMLLTLISHYRRREALQDMEEVELLAYSLSFNIWVNDTEALQRSMKLGSWFQLPPLRPFGNMVSAWYGDEAISSLVHMYTARRGANATYFLDCERYCWLQNLSASQLGWLASSESPMTPALQRRRKQMPLIPQQTTRIVIAFNIQNSHWISASVDIPEKHSVRGRSKGTIAVYDSLSTTGLLKIRTRLQALANLITGLPNLERKIDSWEITQQPCPRQTNAYDCGPITAKVCTDLLLRIPISLAPIDGSRLRRTLTADLFDVFQASQEDLSDAPQGGSSPLYKHISHGAVDEFVREPIPGLWDFAQSPFDDTCLDIPELFAAQLPTPSDAGSEAKGGRAAGQLDHCSGATPSLTKHICPICKNVCQVCVVPTQYGKEKADEMYETAHHVAAITATKGASSPVLVLPIQFARVHELTEQDLIQLSHSALQADAWSMPSALLWKLAETTVRLSRPMIIRETFSDSGKYSPEQISQLLEGRYCEKKIKVMVGNNAQPQDMAVESLTAGIRSSLDTSSQQPLSATGLGDIAKANKPSFTKLYRFTQLERLVDRWKLGKTGVAQKQIHLTAFDVASCLNFNLLSTRGAFSGPGRDASGGKWLRNLFGKVLWWVVPPNDMTTLEEQNFALEGSGWNPRGKSRALVQEQDDILILPHDPGIIHASMTLENALIDGGLFWDDRHLVELLEFMLRGVRSPATTNEPAAFQLPELVQELESYPECQKNLERLIPLIMELRSLKCACYGECLPECCACRMNGRRCWDLCDNHPQLRPTESESAGIVHGEWACMGEP